MLHDDGELGDDEVYCVSVRWRAQGVAERESSCGPGLRTLAKLGGFLRDVDTGNRIPLHRLGNLYVMRAWIKQDDSGLTRPK